MKATIKKTEIKDGHAKSFTIGEENIIISNVGGKYFAVSNVCSHDDGILVFGECSLVAGCEVECPRHGARFNVESGKATKMPAVAPIQRFNIKEIGDELEIILDGDI